MVGPFVTILVKTTLTGLKPIHGRYAQMDIDLSWESAFEKYFNINLDITRYSIKKGVPSAPKHFMSEPIRIWLGEFITARGKYVVQVVESRGKNMKRRPISVPPRTPTKQGRQKRGPSPAPSDATASLSLPHAIAMQQNNGRPKDELPFLNSPPAVREVVMLNDELSLGLNGHGHDWDNGSQYSQASQDSLEDMELAGMPYEDFKPLFVKRAMDNFSNAELLIARESLREMKSTKRHNRWYKWSNMNHLSVNILRVLFDV